MAVCEITIPAECRHEDLASTLTLDANAPIFGGTGTRRLKWLAKRPCVAVKSASI